MLFNGYTIAYIGQGLVPVADAYAGGVSTDVFNAQNFHAVGFIIVQGAIEDSGISNLVKLQACDDTTPSNTADIAFHRQSFTDSTKLWAAPAANASTGYNFNSNNAVSNGIHLVWAETDALETGAAGYEYVRLNIAETANKTVTATVVFVGLKGRYHEGTPPIATS